MASINMPGQQRSPLEGIANALSIVEKVYGIKANSQALSQAEEAMKRKQEEDALKKEQEKRTREGFISQEKLLDYGKDYNIADTASPGALEFKVERDGQAVSKYFTPKSKVEDKNAPLTQSGLADFVKSGGKVTAPGAPGTTTVLAYGVDGKPQQVGLVPPPRDGGLVSELRNLTVQQKKKELGLIPMSEDERLRALNSSDKSRYDNVTMANKAIKDMATALEAGSNRYSVVGDNNYTAALARFREAIGRMQSGGAIGKEERESFDALARSLGDDPQMQRKKLSELQQEMTKRYSTLGFDPKNNQEFATIQWKDPKAQEPAVIPNAYANQGGAKLSADDYKAAAQAQERLKKDPKDATALQVMQILRAKGF